MSDSNFNSHFIFQIAEFLPRALFAYLIILERTDENLSAVIDRNYIVKDMSLSWTRFLNDVKALSRMGILEWHMLDNNVQITLAESLPIGDEC